MKTVHIILLAGFFGSSLLSSCAEQDKEAHTLPKPIGVQVYVPVADSTAGLYHSLTATLASTQRADIATRMMGTLVSLDVQEGDYVTKGQVLGRLLSSDVQAGAGRVEAGIAEAEAMLDNLRKDLSRIEQLYAKGSATAKELDDIRMAHKMAQARVESARQAKQEVETQLGYTVLRAPFSGWVGQRYQQAGSIVSPGMPVLSIEGDQGLKAVAFASEEDLPLLKSSQTVRVHIPSQQIQLQAVIGSIAPNRSQREGLYEVSITLPAKRSAALRAGMYARVELPHAPKADRAAGIWLADSLIVHRGGLSAVYVASSSQEALLRWIRTGRSQDGQTLILSGIEPGDALITGAQGPLQDGAAIQIIRSLP